MIKLVVFDFDGVIADCKEIHYQSLNKALSLVGKEFIINRDEHISTFDGLSTRKKIQLLIETKNFPADKVEEVFSNKQNFTIEMMDTHLDRDPYLIQVISRLKHEGFLIYLASNAVRKTIETGLKRLGVFSFFNKIFSNEDVDNQKPHPQIYLKCMVDAGVAPYETLIVEDSKHGRQAAFFSGAHVCGVDGSKSLTYTKVRQCIDNVQTPVISWSGQDTIVLIPMAGAGTRFKNEGYKLPKPLIDVDGKPMIQRVVENLKINGKYIFIVQKEDYEKYNLGTILSLLVPNCEIVQTEGLTEGAACTTLLAKKYINTDDHLIIANSDQFVEWDSCDFIYNMISNDCDGGILTFKANETKWSYAKTNALGYVSEVAEKKVISDDATVGIYYWKQSFKYIKYAEQMIAKNIRTNNEFYTCPVYNEAIQDNKKIKIFPIKKMWGLGTPEDLNFFKENYKGKF